MTSIIDNSNNNTNNNSKLTSEQKLKNDHYNIYSEEFLKNALSLNSDWSEKLWPFSDIEFDKLIKNWKQTMKLKVVSYPFKEYFRLKPWPRHNLEVPLDKNLQHNVILIGRTQGEDKKIIKEILENIDDKSTVTFIQLARDIRILYDDIYNKHINKIIEENFISGSKNNNILEAIEFAIEYTGRKIAAITIKRPGKINLQVYSKEYSYNNKEVFDRVKWIVEEHRNVWKWNIELNKF